MARRSRSSFPLWPAASFTLWSDLARRSSEMWLASGEVIAQRSARMARMGATPSAADRRELRKMVDEKVSASNESARASALKAAELYQRSLLQWTGQAMRHSQALLGVGKAPRVNTGALADEALRTTAKILTAGLQPYHRRAHGNAKRLRKKP